MTQNQTICSWLRPLASIGLGLSLTISPQWSWADDVDSLRLTTTVRAVQAAEPAVVNIEGKKPANPARAGDSQQVNGMGAGVIIDERGYILTNQHVVQDVGRIEVTLHNGRQFIGRLIARDPDTDLALVKIDSSKPFPVVRCGTSSDLMLGEPVIAIGNPYGYHHTVTEGIISAIKRDVPVNGVDDYPNLIQTDAGINPGNSGGPLLNAHGDMIGINAAVRIGAQGIGFAIPVDRAIDVAAEMIAQYRRGTFESPIAVKTGYESGRGQVTVASGSTQELLTGDVITAVNNRPVNNRLDFELALLGQNAGSTVQVEAERDGSKLKTDLKLDARGAVRAQLTSTNTVQDTVYEQIGVRLETANAQQVRRIDATYKGGMRVTSVKHGSPAFNAQIQPGDILVGLLDWQTPVWDDLAWILKSPEFRSAESPKFHIMRAENVFWGNLELKGSRVR
ncbi:S1C family serine protease [Aureliella helgolandensis]|uniref:Putative periplasmic serine endoprotease DegP-like n=1 Tax=Aureliella helgolandensis TaxID=2527968 RepID=A0A518FZG0_9BACT|nr:trypsin-like peptidase domain-containing protein [Aureliella helgolandensis]QDV21748.1 putative periplasmic serine endoprotease DegP-like precursor [Aureliella helgolandensis]